MCRGLVARASVREGRPGQGTKPMWLRRGYGEVGQRLVWRSLCARPRSFPAASGPPPQAGEQGEAGSSGVFSPRLCFGNGNLFSLQMPDALVSSRWGLLPKISHRFISHPRSAPGRDIQGLEETKFYSVFLVFTSTDMVLPGTEWLARLLLWSPGGDPKKGPWKGLWAQRCRAEAAGKEDSEWGGARSCPPFYGTDSHQ